MKNRQQLAEELFDVLLRNEITKFRSGNYTPADVKNALQLLKDNGIGCEVRKGSPLAELTEALPFNLDAN